MTNRCAVFALVVAGSVASMARASDELNFIFDYQSDMVCGSGTLSGIANGDGWVTIFDGSLHVDSGVYAGDYSLIGNANGTSPIISPTRYFIYDNQIAPDAPVSMNIYGLLFGSGSTEINIWGTGVGNPYVFCAHGNSGNVTARGDFTVAVVPAPGAIALAGLGAVAFGLRRRRG